MLRIQLWPKAISPPFGFNPGRWHRAVQEPVGLAVSAVCGGARPGILPSLLDHSSANGIAFDITQRPIAMDLVHGAREEPISPKMARSAVMVVDVLRVPLVRSPDRELETPSLSRHPNEVHVIGHQAVRFDPEFVLLAIVRKDIEVETPVIFGEEDRLAVVATVGDMV